MSRIHVSIMTCNRPKELDNLLKDINQSRGAHQVSVSVFDDYSDDQNEVQRVALQRAAMFNTRERYGKERFSEWVSFSYGTLEPLTNYDHYIFLPDDVRLCRNFFGRAVEAWETIDDPKKITLNLLVDSSRENISCWTGVIPVEVGHIDYTGWVDGCFISTRRYLEEIHFRVPEKEWDIKNPHLGSGFGYRVSTCLYEKGFKMYRVENSLVKHLAIPSIMNPELRERDSMETVRFVDEYSVLTRAQRKVTASLATIPSRILPLKRVVESLRGQVDRLNIYLNGHELVPEFLKEEWINAALSRDMKGDLGDAGKFFWAEDCEGYYFACDDDIVYPPDYVKRMIAKVEEYGRKAVIGFHGARIPQHPDSYLKSRQTFHCRGQVQTDIPVHVIGTGALAYHTSTITISLEDFRYPNMADIFFAIAAKKQEVSLIVMKHNEGEFQVFDLEDTIFNRTVKQGDEVQTRLLREAAPWEIFSPGRAILDGTVSFKYGGETYSFDFPKPNDHIANMMRKAGSFYELDLLEAIRDREIKGIYIDVGAHIGNHSVYFLKETDASTVISIESFPGNYELLKKNIQRNCNKREEAAVFMQLRGIAGQAGQPVELIPPPSDNSGMASAVPAVVTGEVSFSLDSLVKYLQLDRVDFIKIDVEKFELFVLQGAISILRHYHPVLAIEAVSDQEIEKQRAILSQLGYEMDPTSYGATPVHFWLWEETS